MEIFCNIMNDFTVTFDQFNEYMLNKSIHLIKKTNSNVCIKMFDGSIALKQCWIKKIE